MNRRGVSPVIATVLLIAITLVLAGTIFLWAEGFIGESVQKNGSPIAFSCEQVNFEAGLSVDKKMLEINNQGNVPFYGIEIKLRGQGSLDIVGTITQNIDAGASAQIDIQDYEFASGNELLIIPVLLGNKAGAKIPHTCEDAQGVSVTV